MPAKIAVNGYGTIGKRVADAVTLQDDMRLAGVAKTKPDFEAKLAVRKGYAVYASNKEALAKFEKAGVKAAGVLDDLVRDADLVVDCTPEESGYKSLYEKAGVKAIWQGGEEHSLTNLSFNAAANYADCLGAPFVRVPSCNTTGLIRTLYPLDAHVGVEKVLAVMVRRATDPGDSKKGPSTRSNRSQKCRAIMASTRFEPCSSSRATATRAWKRRTGLSASESRSESAQLHSSRIRGRESKNLLVLPFEALNPLRRPLNYAHEGVELPLARHRAADEATKPDLRACPFARWVIRLREQ